MYKNSLDGFHSWEDTYLCYKKITREYRLIWDFNFVHVTKFLRALYFGVLKQMHS